MIRIPLMPHQQKFCADYQTPYLALIGGFGCGKTFSFCVKTIIMAGLNAGYEGAIAEPTNYLTKTHLIPNMEQALATLKVPYDFEKSLGIFHLHFREGSTKIYCLSGENYQRLVGYNLAFFGSDETDTSGDEIAEEMWNKAISRVRWGPHRQIYSTSTPEGFKFLARFFVEEPQKKKVLETKYRSDEPGFVAEHIAPDRRSIHASSYDNPLLDLKYLNSMKGKYTEAQFKVWAHGQFGNLNNRLVYGEFNRVKNHSDLTLKDFGAYEPLHVGMDFNIDHMAAVCHIIADNLPVAVAELVDLKDVPTMIAEINKRFPRRPIIVYPDASGKNRNAAGVETSMALLRQAGYKVVVNPSNPGVGDRINSMNAMFLNGNGERRYSVNTKMCPFYTSALEQQAWVNGSHKDDKRDHVTDGAGYFIHKLWPLTGKPTLRSS